MSFLIRKISTFLSILFVNEMNDIINRDKKIYKIILKKIKKKKYKDLKITHVNFNNKIYNFIKAGKINNFLRVSFIQKMFFVHNRLFIFFELNELKKKGWNFYRKLLVEDNVGNPVRYFLYPKSSGNRINHVYHLSLLNKHLKINLEDIKYVFEFGGGYGCMARIFSKINKNIKYVIFDTFLVSLLQFYYLKQNKMDVGFNNKHNFVLIDNLKSINKFRINKSLFIANWSLSETPLSLRKKIESHIAHHEFILIAFQEYFEEINNKKYFYDIKTKLKKKYKIKIIKNKFYKGNIINKQNHFFFLGRKN